MNILYVSHESQVNGSTKSLISLLEEMKQNEEIKIFVLIPQNGRAEKELQKCEIPYRVIRYYENYHSLSKKNILEDIIKETINCFATYRLERLVKKEKIELIHTNSSAADIGARVAIKRKIPHVYHIREFMEEDFGNTYRKQDRMKTLIEKSDYVIFISNAIREKYVKKYKIQKSKVIYNGFIREDFFEKRTDLFLRGNLNLLYAGAISEEKGVEIAINAVLCYIENGKENIHLKIVGDGDLRYLAGLSKKIEKAGLTPFIEIKAYERNLREIRRKSDIAVVCSQMEAFGRVSVEAMLAGLLVIGYASGGTKEIIQDGKTGVLFRERSGAALARQLQLIEQEKEKYCKIAEQGQEYANEFFSNKRYSEEVKEVYCEIVGKNFDS